MNRVSDKGMGLWVPRPKTLDAILARLDRFSLRQEFRVQRERALARVLKPYVEEDAGRLVAPLEHSPLLG